MDLKSALAIASRFADSKTAANGEHTVRLMPGYVFVATRRSGCCIPVESVVVEACVPLHDLRRIVAAVGEPVLTKKRTTLHVAGSGSVFKLKCFPTARLLPYPAEPQPSEWCDLDGSALTTLAALTGVLEGAAESSNSLGALRVTAEWAATATQAMMVVLRETIGVSESVTVAPEAVSGLVGSEEGGAVCVGDNKLWVRDNATKQVRWAQALVTPWPDSIVDQMLPATIGTAGRVEVKASLSALKGLSDRAKVLMAGDEYGKLMVDSTAGKLTIAGIFARGDFDGGVEVDAADEIAPVGISPTRLATLLDVVGSASAAYGAGDSALMTFGIDDGTPQPIVLVLGSVESLLMPVVLP